MKKNKMMRLASVLLVLTLLTTSVISGTFAKYTTDGYVQDSARVAKFGVAVVGKTDNENNLFKSTYASDTSDYSDVTVKASTAVVAPGTSGKLTEFAVTGTPEVAVRVIYELEEFEAKNWTINVDGTEEEYFPLIITVGSVPIFVTGSCSPDAIDGSKTSIASIEDVKKVIEYWLAECSGEYPAGTNLSAVNDDLTISWEWSYEDGAINTAYKSDVKDTALGDKAAKATAADEEISISIKVKCTIEQID